MTEVEVVLNVKNRVIVFEREMRDIIEFESPYRLRTECEKQCEIKWNGQIIEEVNQFKYLGLILWKHGSMEGEIQEKVYQFRKSSRIFGLNDER